MATTTNFGWETPDDTDLVKDGALAMRTLGNAIDASMVDLKGGTTGQVLSKNSNTDMDFVWVTSDDANAIQNAIVDAKGDLITATAADTPARLAVGSNGDTLVADSAATTGLRWQGNYAAGKNKIINGDFSVNQRSFSSSTTSGAFTFDRWFIDANGGTFTYSSQTFTPGAAPVAGYEGNTYLRCVTSGQSGSNYAAIIQRIEDVRTLAGQTATVSFWAKASSGTPSILVQATQRFGSGGSSAVVTNLTAQVLSTSWARYSVTFSVPSISGKTIGTGSNLEFNIFFSYGSGSIGVQNNTFEIWGVQVEAGSVATAFQTATGTLQGELAAAMRYYWRATAADNALTSFGFGTGATSTTAVLDVKHPVIMRVSPTALEWSNLAIFDTGTRTALTGLVIDRNNPYNVQLLGTVASGAVQYRPYFLYANNNTAGYIGFSAEL
jgi:hypothetical protein